MMQIPNTEKINIGIALGGGGARGIFHIGVLKALMENSIRPSYVAGTSSGSIVGVLYAAGLSADEMISFAKFGSTIKILRIGNPLRGLINMTMLKKRLRTVLKSNKFEDLKYPLIITASDLQKGTLTLCETGDLVRSVMASCSVPMIFEPVELNGSQHVDGGLFMNLPAEPLRSKVDVLIGSSVLPVKNAEVKELSSLFGIGQRVFDIGVANTSRASRSLCDVIIESDDIVDFQVYNFSRVDELVSLGYKTGLEKITEIKNRIEEAKLDKNNKVSKNEVIS